MALTQITIILSTKRTDSLLPYYELRIFFTSDTYSMYQLPTRLANEFLPFICMVSELRCARDAAIKRDTRCIAYLHKMWSGVLCRGSRMECMRRAARHSVFVGVVGWRDRRRENRARSCKRTYGTRNCCIDTDHIAQIIHMYIALSSLGEGYTNLLLLLKTALGKLY